MPITSSGEKILRYQVPLSGYSTIVNSDLSFTRNLLSGEVYVLPDTEIKVNALDGGSGLVPTLGGTIYVDVLNSSGDTIGSYSQLSTYEFLVTVSASTVTINGVNYASLPATDELNISVINTLLNNVGSLSGSSWLVSGSPIYINSELITTLPATTPGNINVTFNGMSAGTWVSSASTWVVTGSTGSTCTSVSLSASSITPSFNQNITIIATPSGISPTSYTFAYPVNSRYEYSAVTQTSSTFSFSAVGYSSQTIFVSATDGLTTVGSSLNYSVSDMTEVTDFISNASITSTTITNAIRTLALSLWDFGLWRIMYCIYPFVGGTATSHKYNLKNPVDSDAGYRIVFGGGWTHSTSGITGNGTNTYADTRFSNTGASQNSLSFGVYNRTSGNSNWDMAGSQTPRTQLVIATAGSAYWDINNSANSATIAVSSARILGLVSANRYDANNTQWSNDGIGMRTTQLATSAPANNTFVIGAFNTSATLPSNRNYAFAYISSGLTPDLLGHLAAIVTTFQTSLGRNV